MIIKGDPGGGKSHLADSLSKLFVTLCRARFSERAIDYMRKKIAKHEILYLREFMGGTEQVAQGGVSTLKFLAADDRGYVVEIYTKDPETGEPTTVELRIPPITIITTSIAIEIEKQFARRSLSLNVDDSLEQTMGILRFKSQRENDFILEFVGAKEKDTNEKILEAVISMLEPCEIGVLFSDSIIKLFEGSPILPLRLRGDYDKLMVLVKMRAFLYQKQRPWFEKGNKKIIFALPEDFIEILKYAKDTILEMTTGLEKRLAEAIPTVYELTYNTIEMRDELFTGFTVEDFRRKYCPRKSYNYAVKILKGLADAGIISWQKHRGIKIHEAMLTKSEAEKLTVSIAQSDSAKVLQSLAEKEFKNKFSTICTIAQEPIKVNKSAMLNSEFLKTLLQNEEMKSAVELVSGEKSELSEKQGYIASRATVQRVENKDSQPESEKQNETIAQVDSANLGD